MLASNGRRSTPASATLAARLTPFGSSFASRCDADDREVPLTPSVLHERRFRHARISAWNRTLDERSPSRPDRW